MPRTFEFIASASPAGSAAGSFTSIPQTYTDLVVLVKARVNSTYDIFAMQPNGTGSGYNQSYIEGTGGSVTGGRGSSEIAFRGGYIPGSSYANDWSADAYHLMDYTNTSIHKSCLMDTRFISTTTASFSVQMKIGVLGSLSAITSLNYGTANGANFATGTLISLYGIKAA